MPNVSRSQRAPLAIILVAAALIFTVSSVALAAAPAAAPALTSISPVNGSLGQTVSVTLTGTGFSAGGAFINVAGLGVGVTNVSVVNDTSITATFLIVPNANTGGRSVSVTTTGGTSTTANFQVLGAPTLSSITSPGLGPLSLLTVGAAYSVNLTGTNFAAGATNVNVSGSGVAVSNVVSTNSTTLRTAFFTVASNAAAGTRSVTVSTAAGSAALSITVNTDVSSGYMLSTVAGQDVISEGATATSQALPLINDVAFAPNGNLYLAVPGANKVYRVTSDGHISTFAGTGVLGAAGDGGPATSAQLNYPLAVIADSHSNIYIAEGNEIRKVSAADGTISTIAGGSGAGFSGDNGSAFFEKLQNPSGLGIDSSDNLYVIDTGNDRIVKITAATGAITTIAGTFQCFGFSGDNGPATQACLGLDLQTSKLAVDPSGNIYIPDSDNDRVRMIAASNGVISTIAGTGSGYNGDGIAASSAGLSFPTAVVLDSSNPSQLKLYISDDGNNRIREIIGTTVISGSNLISTVAGNGGFLFNGDGSAATSNVSNPLGMALDGSGNLYFVDSESNRVRLLSSGNITTVAGNSGVFSGDGGPAASARFYLPQSIATDPGDNLFIVDTGSARVREVSGSTVTTIAGTGTTLSLTVSGEGGPATSAVLGLPWAVATTTSGIVYIAASTTVFSGTDSRIWQVGLDHNIHTVAGGSTSGYNGDNIPATSALLNGPLGVVVDQSGNIYIADACNFRVRKITAATGMITTIAGNGTVGYSGDGGQATNAQLTQPRQLALDSQGNLYIQDRGNNDSRCDNDGDGNNSGEIRKVATDGTISTYSTAGSHAVAVGGGGTVFVAGDSRIVQVFPDGGSGIIAGGGASVSNVFNPSGLSGLSGDNGPALVGLIGTDALAVNSSGEVLFVDQNDYVVRKATPQTSPVITAFPFGVSTRGGGNTTFTSTLGVGVWGSATAAWNATTSVTTPNGGNWLSISPSSGTGTQFGTLTVTYNVTGLAAGSYNGSITFTSTPAAANGSFTVPVTLTIPPQNIQVNPTDIFLTFTAGGFIQPQNVSVFNQGLGGSINFNDAAIVTSPQWLSVTPSSGSASPQTAGLMTLSFNLAGLSAGFYSGGVTVSSAAGTAAVNSPVTVPVFLQLIAPSSAPSLSSISPANGSRSQAVNVTLTGSNFLTGATVNVTGGTGITVSSVNTVSASSITATLTIDPAAATGSRGISVTTFAGTATSGTQNFTILGAPTLTAINPPAGSAGSAVSVTLTGTGFANGGSTVAVAGSGVTAAVTNFTSATSLTALLTIAANAATGAHNLTVTTAAGTTSPLTFTVSSEAGYIVTTVAGTASVMEGGTAASQPLPFFFDVARDSTGNLYIASQNANKVFKVSGGNISTFAGTGTPGPYGDGGPAASAQLNQPRAVIVDANNNVLIADASNNRIRKVTADGTITTFAGTGAGGFNGDGGPAIFAQLSGPTGLGIDSAGNVYIHDFNNRRIRKVDTNGVMSTMAGNGLTGYNGDGQALLAALNLDSQTSKLAVDGAGNLYIPDAFNNRIRKVTPGGVISTFAGIGTSGSSGDTGPATAAALNTPRAVAFDSSGNLFIADSNNNRIRKVTGSGTISTVAGNGFNGFNGDGGTATSLQLTNPVGLVTDGSGNVYFADSGSNRLRELSTGGALTTLAGNTGATSNDGGAASSTPLYQPGGVALDLSGNLLIADTRDFRIRKVDSITGNISTIAGTGSGSVNGDGGLATAAGLGFINDIFVDSSGNIFVSGSNRVRIITAVDGKINTFAGTGTQGYNGDSISATTAQLNNPQGMTMDGSNNLYIADSNNQRGRMVSGWSYNSGTGVLTPGTITTFAGNGTPGAGGDNGAATSAQLNNPRHLAFDGNADPFGGNHLYIADSNNSKIRVVAGGNISTFSTFGGAAVAYNSGNLYIASGSQIQRAFPDGTSSTVAGLAFGDTGDNGPALMASLNVSSLIANSSGTVFAADSSDNVVRMLSQVSAGSAVLSVSPAGFNVRLGNNNSTGSTATITLGGAPASSFTWTAAATVTTPSGGEWLTLPVASGTGGVPLTLSANASGLAPGIYNGSVSISSPQAANSPVKVPVTLNVLPSTISTSVLSFTPSAQAGGSNPGSTNFTVTQGGSGVNFGFTAAAAVVTPPSGTWLSVAPGSGTTGSGVNFAVSYNITGLSAGVYTGSITLTAANASNSPLVLPVTLTINPNTAPTLTSITPISGTPGQTVNVTLTGSNFNPTSASNIISVGGSGVTVTNITFVSGTSLFATFTISNSAALGADSVMVSNGAGTSGAVTFTVGTVKKRGGQITSQ